MKTPIVDFVNEYIESGKQRLHMPGHKGIGSIEKHDITEIQGADYLHTSEGIIKESETNASKLFGSKMTVFSTEGSSTVIKAMCYLATFITKNNKILAMRNAHKSFIDACALLRIKVTWIKNQSFTNLCSSNIDYSDIEYRLKNGKYACIYLTTPDYLGNMIDLKRVVSIAKKYNVMVVVDNAHGAYLRFLNENLHPLECGVTMCADSAHKTLSCLTGGAYLHINNDTNNDLCKFAKRSISMFSSTSPSYLILQSLDLCNTYIEDAKNRFKRLIEKINNLKMNLKNHGYTVLDSDPFKLTIDASEYGYTGYEMADLLRLNNIEIEYSDPDYIVLMITEMNDENIFDILENTFFNIEKKSSKNKPKFKYILNKKATNIYNAYMGITEQIDIDKALNKVMGYGNISCPPAINIVIPGEIINETSIEIMKYYGYKKVDVLKM